MAFSPLSNVIKSAFDSFFSGTSGAVPVAREKTKAKRPFERSKEITEKACKEAAAVSGALAIPVGPLGMLTILPDLIFVWRIQSQMVVDIAAAFGHAGKVSSNDIAHCLFSHVSENASRELNKNLPIEHQPTKSGMLLEVLDNLASSERRDLVLPIGRQVRQVVTRRLIKAGATRLMPIAGAAVVATYSALDTKAVARTAVEYFSGEKLRAPKAEADFPRAEEMFQLQPIKDITPPPEQGA